ncbi:MAG: hypothetical protein OXN81_08470, partial [Alphaproteobacteria bacterium]|nr:hypothetical protein [Alphaproteobacteria bacterium]
MSELLPSSGSIVATVDNPPLLRQVARRLRRAILLLSGIGAGRMPAPEIDYAKNCEPLERLLASVDRPGDFCAGGRGFAPMPVLAVEGVGTLSFPVPDAQVEALIAAAE